MISVIVAIYNVKEELLRRCLDSLINQTNKNFELILVDDGSTDNSGLIVDSYNKYDFVKVIHKTNGGLSDCRNKGVEASTGDFITFIDGDDYVENNMIDLLYKNINEKTDIFIYPCYVNYQNNEIFNPFLQNDINNVDKKEIQLQSLAKGFTSFYPKIAIIAVAWGKLYRKSFLIDKEISFFKHLRTMEDVTYNLYAFEKARRIDYINTPFYHFVINNYSITNKYNENIVDNYNKQFVEIKKFLDLYKKEKIYYEALDSFKVRTINFYMSNYYFNKNNNKKYKDVKTEIIKVLDDDMYKNAIKNIDYKKLGLYQKLFVYCLNKKYIKCIKILVFIKTKIKNINKKF